MIKALNKSLRRLPGNLYNQRYGVWTTMTLINSDGDVYLFRRRIFQLPWVALYLHDIERGDERLDLHTHPFSFCSIILRGGYTEMVGYPQGATMGETETVRHGRFGVNLFPRGTSKAHTILESEPRTKTLVLAGPRRDSWGFFVEGEGVVWWKEYLLRQGRNPDEARLQVMDKGEPNGSA